jgi:hypothetical protein
VKADDEGRKKEEGKRKKRWRLRYANFSWFALLRSLYANCNGEKIRLGRSPDALFFLFPFSFLSTPGDKEEGN